METSAERMRGAGQRGDEIENIHARLVEKAWLDLSRGF